jgi:hypothetical protein
MSDSLARALAAPPPAAQPLGQQDMLARILMGNPDPGLPQYPGMEQAAPMQENGLQRFSTILRNPEMATPEEQVMLRNMMMSAAGQGLAGSAAGRLMDVFKNAGLAGVMTKDALPKQELSP